MKKILALLLALVMAAGIFTGCQTEVAVNTGAFTYHTYTLDSTANPHSSEISGDSGIRSYLETPLVDISILDSTQKTYQWVYMAATSITDVTESHREDLTKYKVTLPQGKTAADITQGYVFEIKLNQKMKWEDGTPINADSYIHSMKQLLDPKMLNTRASRYYAGEAALAGAEAYCKTDSSGGSAGSVTFENVGLYKVDEHTLRYVCQNAIEKNRFLAACTEGWLYYDGDTDWKHTASYGPYRITSWKTGRQLVLEQNESWYGWEKRGDQLVSFTDFPVDGKIVQQYQTTRIVIDVISDPAEAKESFLKGQLTDWMPSPQELIAYGSSQQLYKAEETYTMSFFFNTDLADLQEMDASKGNVNSAVLSSTKFRQAMSLAIDRADLVTATAGYTPAFTVMNDLYYYDVYNNPGSSYRKSAQAMEAICRLYGVAYGAGSPYATLEDAYQTVNGRNMEQAKALMAQACDELVEAGVYKRGEAIKIHIGWAKGAITAADEAQINKLEHYFNEALTGSGFGAVDLVGVGNIDDRYAAVPKGEYAMGWGSWGGAAFYPFQNFQLYCDPGRYSINEAACWDPRTEKLTLTVNGVEETMTWQAWSRSMMGTGKFANGDMNTKLQITAQLEEQYLKKYYRIPVCTTTVCSMLSEKVFYYTKDYSIMYGWGGLRLLQYRYNDAQWSEYVASQDGALKYE